MEGPSTGRLTKNEFAGVEQSDEFVPWALVAVDVNKLVHCAHHVVVLGRQLLQVCDLTSRRDEGRLRQV